MTKPTAWMPFYVGDYLRDTGHLTTHQHGAYLLLIMHYWSTGRAPPDDDRQLAQITRQGFDEWQAMRGTLAALFKIEKGLWHHPRIERELTAAFDRSDHGRRGAQARWRDARASIGHGSGNASHSHINDHESENLTGAARDPAPADSSGPRARRETTKERLARLALEARQKLLRKDSP